MDRTVHPFVLTYPPASNALATCRATCLHGRHSPEILRYASTSPVRCISLLTSTQRRTNSSGLSASAVSDSVGLGADELGVGSGIFGSGAGSSEQPARSNGTVRVSASARRTCMKCLPENNVSTSETTQFDASRTTLRRRSVENRLCGHCGAAATPRSPHNGRDPRISGDRHAASAEKSRGIVESATHHPAHGLHDGVGIPGYPGNATGGDSRRSPSNDPPNTPRGGPPGPPLGLPLGSTSRGRSG